MNKAAKGLHNNEYMIIINSKSFLEHNFFKRKQFIKFLENMSPNKFLHFNRREEINLTFIKRGLCIYNISAGINKVLFIIQ